MSLRLKTDGQGDVNQRRTASEKHFLCSLYSTSEQILMGP
jgi:hypothetical protein